MTKKDFVLDLNDMGFSFGDDIEEEKNQYKDGAEESQRRLDKLYDTVNSFLDNMAKNPEQKTLVWPNRAEKIAAFKEMLKRIKEGEI